MEKNYIRLPSFWGMETRHEHISNHSSSLVVLFPGKNYSCDLPLLYYARSCAVECKHDVLSLEYGYQSARTEHEEHDLPIVTKECLIAIQQIADQYSNIIFVSKSMGTIIAGEIAKELGYDKIQHIYLTPLDQSVMYIQQSKGIVIYGTNDPMFSEEQAKLIEAIGIRVVPIKNASHSLEVGHIFDSLEILSSIIQIYFDFFQTK
ncbi:hypothetical protein D3C81_1395840 [compost metagenome]